MVISTTIKNLHQTQLVQDHLRKESLRHYVFEDDMFEFPAGKTTPIAREELVGDSRKLAAEAANDLLRQFGFRSIFPNCSELAVRVLSLRHAIG